MYKRTYNIQSKTLTGHYYESIKLQRFPAALFARSIYIVLPPHVNITFILTHRHNIISYDDEHRSKCNRTI